MIVGQNTLLNQYVPTFLIKNLYDGQILEYDSTRRAFVNVDPITASGGVEKLGQLLNVSPTVDSTDPSVLKNGESLIYNSLSGIWTNQFVDYNTLLNQPTSINFSFAGLSDTTKPALPNGYVLWNSTGDQLVYSTTIPASSITGLPPVAVDGTLGSLLNVDHSADTLNNTTDVGKGLVWSGQEWVPFIPVGVNVIQTMTALNALPHIVGSQAYVINSDDGTGNYLNQWSIWLYTGTGPQGGWTLLSRQVTSSSESTTAEFTFGPTQTPPAFIVGSVTTGGRITLITVEVSQPFIIGSTLEIGYSIPSAGVAIPSALMTISEIDLTTPGTYLAGTNILFGTDTPTGDVNITANLVSPGSVYGLAQIIVSYV